MKVRASTVLGDGLFAKQHIARGTLIWNYVPGANVLLYDSEAATKAHLQTIPTREVRARWIELSYIINGKQGDWR